MTEPDDLFVLVKTSHTAYVASSYLQGMFTRDDQNRMPIITRREDSTPIRFVSADEAIAILSRAD